MNLDEFVSLIKETGLPVTNRQKGFSKEPSHNTYLVVYEDGSTPFCADNIVYFKSPHYAVELYSPKKNPELERKIEQIFIQNQIPVIDYQTYLEEIGHHVTLWETKLK